MRKHFIKIILMFIITFIFGLSSVKAMCGDLVYDVLDMKITDKNIIIDGWAFIHHTQNGFNLNGDNTNQKIKINLCNSNETKCYYGAGEGEIQGSGFNFNDIMKYNGTLEYRYENIGFYAIFENQKIAEIFNDEGEQTLHFTISATNDDYNARHSNCNGTELFNNMVGTTQKYENGKYWVKEKLKILKDTIKNSSSNNEFVEIKATGTDKLLYTGWHTISGKKGTRTIHIGWGQIYKYKGKNEQPIYSENSTDTNPGTYTLNAKLTKDEFFSLSDAGWRYYTCANYDENGNENNNYLNIREYQDNDRGVIGFCTSVNSNNYCIGSIINPISSNTYTCDEERTFNKSITYAKVYGDTILTIKVKNDKKCEVSEPSSNKTMSCNNWTNLSSTCKELTVRNGNSSATVKIVQNGYISNIFKSNLVNNDKDYDASSYDGGWFKYGIIYYNEVSWESPNLSQDNEKKIEEAMQYRLKDNFEENLNLTINGLYGSRLIKKCNQSGEFKNGEKLVTVCTFFLPDIDAISSTGKVSYKESDDNDNINNKYYIPFNENENEHSVSVILTGLSRLSDNQGKDDSKDNNKSWFGTWEIDTDCKLKVINRLYNPPGEEGGDGKLKYKFIYRPIDLSNPFPNRFPGVNWYSWYIVENNKGKKTLEDSYKKLEYSAELNNATISQIKEYNKKNTYFGEVDEDFFKTYIKEGGNS